MLLWALLVLAATPAALSSAFGGNVGLQATLQVHLFLRPLATVASHWLFTCFFAHADVACAAFSQKQNTSRTHSRPVGRFWCVM